MTQQKRPQPRARHGQEPNTSRHVAARSTAQRQAEPRPDAALRRQRESARRPERSERLERPERTQRALATTAHAVPEAARPESHVVSAASAKRYIASLDGLRALAVIAVIFYHLDVTWAQGGLLGVTVFFVLSGYLITGLLVNEVRDTGRINLPQFWLRRVRRLFPAIFTVVVVVAALCVLFNHPLLTKMRPDIVPSLFWFQNWWYILRGQSYFAALGDPSPLTHFWSLAIEEQFYVVWPLILLVVFKAGAKRRHLRRVCLVLAIVSMVLMGVLYDPNADPTRVYYGTDTRAFSLLIGAWLALAWPGNQLSEESTASAPKTTVRLLDIAGLFGLVGVICMMVLVDGTAPFMFRGGIAATSLLTALAMAALVHPRSLLAKFFSLPPLVWIGKRSYGMYLWHYPIILLLKPFDPSFDGHSWWFFPLVFVLVFVVSALSYTFVEEPIRHGAIGRFVTRVRERGLAAQLRLQTVVPSVACVAVLAFTVVGCTVVPDTSVVPEEAIVSTGVAAGQGMKIKPAEETDTADTPKESTKLAYKHQKNKFNPLLIGDSVPGDSQAQFKEYYSYGLIDCYIGRWFWQARDVYKDYKNDKTVGRCVVFSNFSNHPLQDDELSKMYKLVGKKKEIFLVNIEAPEKFEKDTNKKLAEFADAHDNVHLVDWNAACKGNMKKYLWDDKTHLRPEGAKAFERLIFDAVSPYLPKKDIKKAKRKLKGELSAEEAARVKAVVDSEKK